LHGSPGAVAEQRDLLEAIGEGEGGGRLDMSGDADVQRRLWRARHQALPAARALRPGAVTWITDVCVPISSLADAIATAQAAVQAADLLAPILGHVGDGNFHIFFVLDPDQPDQWRRAEQVSARVIDHALSVGGTCTGEHGIGLGKREALVAEHGAVAIDIMRQLKSTLDPDGVLNPDKVFSGQNVRVATI
jgi:D-lactate dehydrogenase (cytochrome)